MRGIFWGFCINRFGIGPLDYVSSRSDFGFEFADSPTRRVFFKHLKADFPTCRVGESFFDYEYLREFESKNRNGSKRSVRDLCRIRFMLKPRKSVSLPCPFKYKVECAIEPGDFFL
jgi:hypothetical protein